MWTQKSMRRRHVLGTVDREVCVQGSKCLGTRPVMRKERGLKTSTAIPEEVEPYSTTADLGVGRVGLL